MAVPRLLTAGLFIYSFTVCAQIRLVHVTTCGSIGMACTVPSTGRGNLIVIGWQISEGVNTSTTINRVTDNVGNIYTRAVETGPIKAVSGSLVDLWYAKNGLPGATSLRITPNPGVANGQAVIWEFSGVDPNEPIDQFKGKDWAGLMALTIGVESVQTNQSRTSAPAAKTVPFKAARSAASGANACDLNQDATVNVLDGQLAVNATCTGGVCNGGVVAQVINAALGGSCSHSVSLNWTASTSANVDGYNVYRASVASGPYTKVNSFLVRGTSYSDATVEAGLTYYYVATTVDTTNAESAYSNKASAMVPSQ